MSATGPLHWRQTTSAVSGWARIMGMAMGEARQGFRHWPQGTVTLPIARSPAAVPRASQSSDRETSTIV